MLYTTYRPQKFSDVVGQEINLLTIIEQIKKNSYDSAYLFAGHRGTGKTTIARILARTINCDNPTEYGPCNQCKNCVSMLDNTTFDFQELDAASHNSITDIKELVASTKYLPTTLKKKVYIIDEAHNLSASAFDALLKTIEEPPEHCIFILCTTELHKIPATIKSRCSIYKFSALSIETIRNRLIYILQEQKKEYEDVAVDIIAKQADGSMRDALSIAEKLVISCNVLTVEHVKTTLCLMDDEIALTILQAVMEQKGDNAINHLQTIYEDGKNLSQVVDNLLQTLTDGILLLSSGGEANLYNSVEYKNALYHLVKKSNLETMFWYVEELSDLHEKIRNSLNPYMDVMVYLVRCCNPKLFEHSEAAIIKRISAIEDKLEKGMFSYDSSLPSKQINFIDSIEENDKNSPEVQEKYTLEEGWETVNEKTPFEEKTEEAQIEYENSNSDDDSILGLFSDYL